MGGRVVGAMDNLFCRSYAFLKGYHRKSIFPSSIFIEVTNHCNLRCPMCPRRYLTRRLMHMDLLLFKKLIDEISFFDSQGLVKLVGLHAFGEPLLHPRFVDMLTYAGEKLSRVSQSHDKLNPTMSGLVFSTNAVFLTPEKARGILHSNATVVGLSIDGATKKTYERMRGPGSFEKVIENMEYLLREKRSLGRQNPLLAIQIIRTKITVKEIEDFKTRWSKTIRGVPGSAIFIKPYTDWAGQVNEPSFWERKKGIFFHRPCGSPWNTLVIYASGSVTVCCYDVNGKLKIGNVMEQSLTEIWRSEALEGLRNILSSGAARSIEMCKNCDMARFYVADLRAVEKWKRLIKHVCRLNTLVVPHQASMKTAK